MESTFTVDGADKVVMLSCVQLAGSSSAANAS